MKLILVAELATFSATIAIAPLVCPVISSPMIYSAVVVDGLVIAVRTTEGHDKVPLASLSAAS